MLILSRHGRKPPRQPTPDEMLAYIVTPSATALATAWVEFGAQAGSIPVDQFVREAVQFARHNGHLTGDDTEAAAWSAKAGFRGWAIENQ